MYRKGIGTALGSLATRSIKAGSIEIGASAVAAQATPEAIGAPTAITLSEITDPAVLEQAGFIKTPVEQKPEADRFPYLIKEAATLTVQSYFYQLYSLIYGSQLHALWGANQSAALGFDSAQIRTNSYDPAVARDPVFYASYAFDKWLTFMVIVMIIAPLACSVTKAADSAPTIPYPYSITPAEPDRRGTTQQPLVISSSLDEHRRDELNEARRITIERGTAVGTIVLALITAGLAIFTYRLWRSTGELVRDARKTAVRQLRAYIFVESSRICAADENRNVMEPNQRIFAGGLVAARILFRNFGQTPAYDAEAIIGLDLCDWPLAEDLRPKTGFDDPHISRASVGPTASREIYVFSQGKLTMENVADLQSGKKAIFVYGEIRYRDAFGNPSRFTKYRFYTGGAAGIPGLSLAAHVSGNEADEELPDFHGSSVTAKTN